MRPPSNLQLGSRRARFGLCDIRFLMCRSCHPISPIDNPPSAEELPAQSGPSVARDNPVPDPAIWGARYGSSSGGGERVSSRHGLSPAQTSATTSWSKSSSHGTPFLSASIRLGWPSRNQ